MSELAETLERAVARYGEETPGGALAAMRRDRAFAHILALLQPRIAGLVRRYGFIDMPEDAQQACAIGVLRALSTYDPARAQFTTHVTWAMRGELQSLRHRERIDQRQGARKAGVRFVSADCREVWEVVDEAGLAHTEAGASTGMARQLLQRLLSRSGQPADERCLVVSHVLGKAVPAGFRACTPEQRRQIIRRNLRHCARVVQPV